MFWNRIRAGILAACAFALVVPAALAADDTNITVSSGSLGITTAPTVTNFAGVTLDGTAKTTTATMTSFEVNDARGTGAGWNVTVQATQFKEHDGTDYVTSGKTLATSSLSMEDLTPVADGTTSTAPTSVGPWTIDSGAAVKVASAALDAGMGKYDLNGTGASNAIVFTLSIPASAFAKTYRSDVTVTVATGP